MRQAVIFNELARVLQLEQTARSHVAGLEVQLDQTGKIPQVRCRHPARGSPESATSRDRELTSEHDGAARSDSKLSRRANDQ